MDISNINFDDLINCKNLSGYYLADEVIVYDREHLSAMNIVNSDAMQPVRLDAKAFILCSYGELSFSVDYKPYRLTKGSLLVLNSRHIIDNIRIGSSCEAMALIVSRKLLMSVSRDTPIVRKMMTASASTRSHSKPVMQLNEVLMRKLTDIVMRIKKNLKTPDHMFQSHIIKNETGVFIMEIVNAYLQTLDVENKPEGSEKESRKDAITREFIRLVLNYCKEQHEVAFYAGRLGMTTSNLSRTVTLASGKSPMQWISGALIADAKILLRKPDVTVKHVAVELHFGDQSSFGKFFKKHAGITPIEYKNGI